jgi:hypothetical protein
LFASDLYEELHYTSINGRVKQPRVSSTIMFWMFWSIELVYDSWAKLGRNGSKIHYFIGIESTML